MLSLLKPAMPPSGLSPFPLRPQIHILSVYLSQWPVSFSLCIIPIDNDLCHVGAANGYMRTGCPISRASMSWIFWLIKTPQASATLSTSQRYSITAAPQEHVRVLQNRLLTAHGRRLKICSFEIFDEDSSREEGVRSLTWPDGWRGLREGGDGKWM